MATSYRPRAPRARPAGTKRTAVAAALANDNDNHEQPRKRREATVLAQEDAVGQGANDHDDKLNVDSSGASDDSDEHTDTDDSDGSEDDDVALRADDLASSPRSPGNHSRRRSWCSSTSTIRIGSVSDDDAFDTVLNRERRSRVRAPTEAEVVDLNGLCNYTREIFEPILKRMNDMERDSVALQQQVRLQAEMLSNQQSEFCALRADDLPCSPRSFSNYSRRRSGSSTSSIRIESVGDDNAFDTILHCEREFSLRAPTDAEVADLTGFCNYIRYIFETILKIVNDMNRRSAALHQQRIRLQAELFSSQTIEL